MFLRHTTKPIDYRSNGGVVCVRARVWIVLCLCVIPIVACGVAPARSSCLCGYTYQHGPSFAPFYIFLPYSQLPEITCAFIPVGILVDTYVRSLCVARVCVCVCVRVLETRKKGKQK